MENNVMTAREWTNSPNGGNGFIEQYEAMTEYAKYFHEAQSQQVEWSQVKSEFDDRFISSQMNTDQIEGAESVFEWFKSRLAGSVSSEGIKSEEDEIIKFAKENGYSYLTDYWYNKNVLGEKSFYCTMKLYNDFKTK